MNRERERLDRLMAMLASETDQGRDMRQAVLRRLGLRHGASRRRAVAAWTAAAASLLVAGWVGFQAWQASRQGADLGDMGRRGAQWLLPSEDPPRRVMPVRYVPRPRGESPMAVAPWGRT